MVSKYEVFFQIHSAWFRQVVSSAASQDTVDQFVKSCNCTDQACISMITGNMGYVSYVQFQNDAIKLKLAIDKKAKNVFISV